MRFIFIFALVAMLAPVCVAQMSNDTLRVKVQAIGQAPAELLNARQAAVEDALRRAVEAGGGVELASASETRDFVLASDVIYTKTAGYVQRYEVLQENPDQDGLYTVRVEAIISKGDINADLIAFKALLRRKGHPRLMVVGSVDGKPFENRLTAIIQDQLEGRDITVIDVERLGVNKQRDAQRAAKGDDDIKRAALIAQETGADYLVTVSIEGEHLPSKTLYGITTYPVNAVAILKVIRADTAVVLSSKVVEVRVSSENKPQASRNATTQAVTKATQLAIGRVAEHWVSDVDQRGGQQVEIVLHNCSFEQVGKVIAALRQTGGVKQVIADQTDAEGRSKLRVITNSSAADLAYVLTKIDPTLKVVTASKYQVNIRPKNMSEGAMGLGVINPVWAGIAIAAVVLIIAALFALRAKR